MILVTGASGHLGKATIESLLNNGYPAGQIAALVRDTAKAADLAAKGVALRTGDYNDKASLVKAFAGIEKLLLISSNDLEARTEQQKNAIDAAKEAGVKHVLYTSVDIKDAANTALGAVVPSHMATADYLKASGLRYTLLNNTLYADVLPMFFGEKVLETGIFFPAGDGKVPYTNRLDMAEAAANVLAGEGHENKEYAIGAEEAYSLHEVSQLMTGLAGREIPYLNPPTEVYTAALTEAGVPAMYVGMFKGFGEAIAAKEFETGNSDLEKLLGRKPTALKDYLKATWFSGN